MLSPSVPDQKSALRTEALARRDALDPAWRAEASGALAERALAMAELRGLEPVAGFWPIKSEIDIRPLLEGLAARGQGLCLPVVAEPHMLFRAWRPGEPLEKTRLGVNEPREGAREVVPRALLVPLAAFDRQGGRIGYGRGHYDTAIAALANRSPLLTIGVGFSAQEVERVPQEPHDRRLDFVVTEAELIPIPSR